jgi:23S rRNA (adenine2503-C2)-methyltransferase
MQDLEIVHAVEDESVNFIRLAPGGAFEARYVRRTAEYMIAYLSSQAGCDRACRFCHLTATGQTAMTQAGVQDYVRQIADVLSHHDAQSVRPSRMNVNYMARGEPLLNPIMQDRGRWLDMRFRIRDMAALSMIDDVRHNVSTIMPREALERPLEHVFGDGGTTIYYSLYSMDPAFRRRWLPKSADPVAALDHLARFQKATGLEVALHWAFIAGENDDVETLHRIVDAVHASGLRPKFNAVRYNPFDDRRGREPEQEIVERNFAILAAAFEHPSSRIVPRVGFSAKASCGMFADAND